MMLQRETIDKTARRTRLEAEDALQLYMARITDNVAVLDEQAALLSAALAERTELLCKMQPGLKARLKVLSASDGENKETERR
jgi:hypothetical protein